MDDEQTPIWNGPMLNALCCVWHGLSSTNSDQTMLATPAGPSAVDKKLQGLWHTHTPPVISVTSTVGQGKSWGYSIPNPNRFPDLTVMVAPSILFPCSPNADRESISPEWKEPAAEEADGKTSGNQVPEPRCQLARGHTGHQKQRPHSWL